MTSILLFGLLAAGATTWVLPGLPPRGDEDWLDAPFTAVGSGGTTFNVAPNTNLGPRETALDVAGISAMDPEDWITHVSLLGRVVELVDDPRRLYPVGRLDYETTGLILLTNDGELAHRLTHPSFEVPRPYHAKVRHAPVREGGDRHGSEAWVLNEHAQPVT